MIEIRFNESDRVGEFTLLEGDIVQFKVATDKRTKYKRAVDVILMEHSLFNNNNNKEKRECGVIDRILFENNNKYGAIQSIERDELVFFQANEFICLNKRQSSINFDIGDCVEFTVVESQKASRFLSL